MLVSDFKQHILIQTDGTYRHTIKYQRVKPRTIPVHVK